MSRATIRAAVQTYFDSPAVPGLLKVHPAKPRNWDPAEWRSDTLASTASSYVLIEGSTETREALGKKMVTYTIGLVFLFRSAVESMVMIDAYDSLVDAIIARLRLDPHLGQSPGVVFQAGQSLIENVTDDTRYQAAESEMWGVVRFDVSEWVTA